MITNKQWVEIEINVVKTELKNCERDYKSALRDYGDSEVIGAYTAITNLANLTSMASEIKVRKYALEHLENVLKAMED